MPIITSNDWRNGSRENQVSHKSCGPMLVFDLGVINSFKIMKKKCGDILINILNLKYNGAKL